MLSLSANGPDVVLDDEQIMIALRDLAIMHQTDLSAWNYVLTDEEIIFTHPRLGETRWQLCKVLRAARPLVLLPQNLEEQIRRRTYELYETCGREDRHDLDDWLRAENEITRQKTRTIAA